MRLYFQNYLDNDKKNCCEKSKNCYRHDDVGKHFASSLLCLRKLVGLLTAMPLERENGKTEER